MLATRTEALGLGSGLGGRGRRAWWTRGAGRSIGPVGARAAVGGAVTAALVLSGSTRVTRSSAARTGAVRSTRPVGAITALSVVTTGTVAPIPLSERRSDRFEGPLGADDLDALRLLAGLWGAEHLEDGESLDVAFELGSHDVTDRGSAGQEVGHEDPLGLAGTGCPPCPGAIATIAGELELHPHWHRTGTVPPEPRSTRRPNASPSHPVRSRESETNPNLPFRSTADNPRYVFRGLLTSSLTRSASADRYFLVTTLSDSRSSRGQCRN